MMIAMNFHHQVTTTHKIRVALQVKIASMFTFVKRYSIFELSVSKN